MKVSQYPFEEVSSRYGAPMGRAALEGTPEGKIKVVEVPITDGYDPGGAYWGYPADLYCAHAGPNYRRFIRAAGRVEAIHKLRIPLDQLAKPLTTLELAWYHRQQVTARGEKA